MDRTEVREIVDRELAPLMRRLGVAHWDIGVSFKGSEVDDDGSLTRGECCRLVDYDSAHVTLNHECFADEAGVLKTLRHELMHVVLSPFDLYTEAVDRLGLDEATQRVIDRVWYHACERAVINLERMYRGLTS